MGDGITIRLGEVAASEQLISDLYLDLRRRTRQWAAVTKQTAQARMGYIGQHLVSVVTGLPGGRSGARGHDLLHKDGRPGEIKTCYRVDQLGKCGVCDEGVSPDENVCASCGSTKIVRKDDSKWLISLRNEVEYAEILTPSLYYLVLFEFTDLAKRDSIDASIWIVDPRSPGFLLCMVDYYHNTRAASPSKAPFNLWPHSFKFAAMRPRRIYRAKILSDDSIDTLVFPGVKGPLEHDLLPLAQFATSRVPLAVWQGVAEAIGLTSKLKKMDKEEAISVIEAGIKGGKASVEVVCDTMAKHFYGPLVKPHFRSLPSTLKVAVKGALQ